MYLRCPHKVDKSATSAYAGTFRTGSNFVSTQNVNIDLASSSSWSWSLKIAAVSSSCGTDDKLKGPWSQNR